jgi:hypothetical protein
MTPQVAVEQLTRAELLFLLKRNYRIDQRDIANCRWEMAEDEAKRLRIQAEKLEDAEIEAVIASVNAPANRKLRAAQLTASQAALHARNVADRARRRAEARFKTLRSFHLDTQK